MRIVLVLMLFLVDVKTYGQTGPTRNWVDSEVKYTDPKGNIVGFTNSLPKGGGMVFHNGEKYGYVVFWTRVINQSGSPMELKVIFPEITYFKYPDSHSKVILPKETMNDEKVQLFDYGLINLQSIISDGSNQLRVMKRMVQPKEDHIFYVAVFIHIERSGSARAAFVLKDQDLFYKISIGSDTTLIPCGSIRFQK
jgi:hypothetical protein